MTDDLIGQITRLMPEFSKGQKLIAAYIMAHYDKAAFMTASRLGQTVGTSESTVVRFATELGFVGYPHLQKELQRIARNKLTSVQRIEVSNEIFGDQDILSTVLHSDIDKIRKTLESISNESFERAIEMLLGARRIYILGVRSSAALAVFLGFYLNLIFDNVRTVSVSSVSEMFEQMLHVSKGDVVVGISYPRYSRRTIKAMRYAASQNADVLAITDNEASPLAPISSVALFANSDMASFADSLVAPLSLINALIVAIGMKRKVGISETFDKLETIWNDNKVYDKPEDE